MEQVATIAICVLLDNTASGWEHRVVDVQYFLFEANTSDYGVAVEEREVSYAYLTELRRHQRREQWIDFARCFQIEVHHEKLSTSVDGCELVSVRVELNALDSGLLWIGLVRGRVLVQ